MKIFLVRHGKMAGDPFVTPSRPVSGCLSADVGIPQAKAAAAALKNERIDVAFSSSYGRALQTAEIVLGGRDTPIHIMDCLKEWIPNAELRGVSSTRFEDMCSRDRDRYIEETWKTELGEGTYDMYARIIPPLLAEMANVGIYSRMGGFVADKGAEDLRLAIFAHGGSLNVMLSHLLGLPPFPSGRFSFEETGVAVLNFTERRGIHYPSLHIPSAMRFI